MVYLAAYDLDRFREQVVSKGPPHDLAADREHLQAAREDDVALLRLAHAWVKKLLQH